MEFYYIKLKRISTESESKWHPTNSRSWIWSQERHLSTLTIVKATATRNRMRYNVPILVSRTLAFLLFALITVTVARTIWLKFRWQLSANQMITLESLHSAALSPSSASWKNWRTNCIRWFCGAMVAPHNFVPSLYLHCLLISTEILHYNGTIMRPPWQGADGRCRHNQASRLRVDQIQTH